MSGHYGQS